MGKYDNILICSDLDGTLLGSDGKLSGENLEAINRFCDEGGKFCISTGRLPSHLLKFFPKEFFKSPVICCNGACIYDYNEDKILYAHPLGEKKYEIYEFLEKNSDQIIRTTIFVGPTLNACEGFKENAAWIKETLSNTIYKVVLSMQSPKAAIELRDKLTQKFGEFFNFSRSWDTGVEILDHYATKGHTINHLKNILGGKLITICVGDYENDITMIQVADIGCAVKNAVPQLKAVADRIICSNDEHATKYIVENICDKLI
ncbi:MAG: HAD family hydrolase [Ruminococcaceae bacterium]|nr:HAD family hydrolase [Oscillospiraceae bacterium]